MRDGISRENLINEACRRARCGCDVNTVVPWAMARRKLDPEGNTDRSSIRIQVANRVDELPSEESDSRQMLT
ncbi:Hypothetical protein NTJ_14467 [Nesidiocoris tenuis]|uniref:Transposase n=1 Tax=Nesidiocoris tenuis TaxID=355587 RepID=A0ABN7BB88_9HEMI|nr:Hypothetical protein NTJ_14467 [Nesidiocoris tenuis]